MSFAETRLRARGTCMAGTDKPLPASSCPGSLAPLLCSRQRHEADLCPRGQIGLSRGLGRLSSMPIVPS